MENSTTDGIVQSTNTSDMKSMVATPPNVLLVVIFWLIFCFGVSGNSVLLCVNITQRSVKQAATQLFIISLALSDLGLLLGTTWIKAYLSLDPNYIFGNFVCKFTSIWMSVAGDASVATLTVIGVDRYLSISRPGNIYFSFRQAVTVMFIIWVIVIATDIPMALWFNVFATGPSSLTCAPTFDVHAVARYTLIGRIIQFFVPLGIIVVSYGGIWLKLTLSRRQVVADIRSKPADNSSYRKVAKMCTVVVVVFLATWIPFEIDLLYYAYGSNQQLAVELMTPLSVLMNANSCVNPVIYGFMWKPMKVALAKLWLQNPCRRYRNKHRESSNEASTRSTKSAISHPTAGQLQHVAAIEHGE